MTHNNQKNDSKDDGYNNIEDEGADDDHGDI